MNFNEWLLSEVRHISFEDAPLVLSIEGRVMKATGIDFKWEDFNQAPLAAKQFVQEFPHHVAESGLVFVNCGYFEGWWFEHLHPGKVQQLRTTGRVFADSESKKLFLGTKPQIGSKGSPVSLLLNPLNEFTKIPRKSIINRETGQPARFRSPYDRKEFLHWWDFTEVVSGNTVIKQPARVRE